MIFYKSFAAVFYWEIMSSSIFHSPIRQTSSDGWRISRTLADWDSNSPKPIDGRAFTPLLHIMRSLSVEGRKRPGMKDCPFHFTQGWSPGLWILFHKNEYHLLKPAAMTIISFLIPIIQC